MAVEGISKGLMLDGNQLSMLVRECDTGEPLAFFPLTVALRRLGFKVLYYGYEPDLVAESNGLLDGMSNSYVVTERLDDCVGLNIDNTFAIKECWALPLLAHQHLLAFQNKCVLDWQPLLSLTLWDTQLTPANFPTAQYIDTALQSRDVVHNSTNAQLEYKVSMLKKALHEKEQAVFGLELVVAQGDSDLKDKDDRIGELTQLYHSLDYELDCAEATNMEIVDELQKARKQAYDRADVIIKMAEATENAKSGIPDCEAQAYRDANGWQADKIVSLTKANTVLKRRVIEQTEQVNVRGKPVYEVNASKEVSLSSFKMSTIATAIRWISTAATVGSIAYLLGG